MKLIISIFAILTTALTLSAQEKVGDVVKAGDTAYMLVREFNTPEQNENFQRNFEIMRRHSDIISAVKKKLEEEKDDAKKKDLAAKLKQAEDEFEINDRAMQKAYAFASSRQYRFVFIDSNICTPLTKEELSALRDVDGKDLDPLKIVEKNGVSFYRAKFIEGVKANEELQRQLSYSLTRKMEIEQSRKKLSLTTDAEEQLKLSGAIANSEKALKENDDAICQKYGIRAKSEYLVEIAKSRLYLILTPEEIAKIDLQQAKIKSSQQAKPSADATVKK